MIRPVFLTFFLLLIAATAVKADESFTPGNRHVKTRLIVDRTAVQPPTQIGQATARIGVYFSITQGWHIYWRNSGEGASPTRLRWNLPEGFSTEELRWPYPNEFHERGDIRTFGYKNEVLLFTQLVPPAIENEGDDEIALGTTVDFLVCKDVCLPGQRTHTLHIPFSPNAELAANEDLQIFERFELKTPRTLASISLLQDDFLAVASTEASPELGDEFSLLLTLRTNASLKEAIKALKVFPHDASGYLFGRAKLVDGSEPGKVSVRVPVKQNKPEADDSISGILVITEPVVAVEELLAVKWNWQRGNGGAKAIEQAGTDLELLVSKALKTTDSNDRSQSQSWSTQFILALIGAFFAGMILNLMPCVLPVISIKVFSFLEKKEHSRRQVLLGAYAYSVGILASFLALASVVILLKEFGHSLRWGFQMQEPTYVLTLLVVVFVFSLAFFEFYQFNIPGLHKASRALDKKEPSLARQFFDGILATALATPCTAPFLATAMVFALEQSAATIIAIFLSLGAGLALPYAYLTTHPKLLQLLPKPGEWMNWFRQLLGFLLLGTAVWLLYSLEQITEFSSVWAVLLLLIIAFSIWLFELTRKHAEKSAVKLLALTIGILLSACTTSYLWPLLTTVRSSPGASTIDSSSIQWDEYSDERVAELLATGQPVFIDFTADWCITCKAMETLVLDTERTAALFKKYNIQAVKADYTLRTEAITRALRLYDGGGVPHYVLISPRTSATPVILPTVLTHGILRDYVEDTFGS